MAQRTERKENPKHVYHSNDYRDELKKQMNWIGWWKHSVKSFD